MGSRGSRAQLGRCFVADLIHKIGVAPNPYCPTVMGVTANSLLRSPVLNSAPFCGAENKGVNTMIKFLKTLRRDELGAAAAEYALILAVVGGGIAVAALALGTKISGAITRITALIN